MKVRKYSVLRSLQVTVVTLGILTAAGTVWAQDPKPSDVESLTDPEVIYKKETVVNFGEDTISGDLQLPDGEYIESRKRLRHSNLIRIRDNFRDKILRSISSM